MLNLVRTCVFISASVAMLLFAAVVPVGAQESTTGSIAGHVVDEQGAPIPGATVTITSDRGTRSTVSDATGHFFAPYLVPGLYSIRVELDGFTPVERRDVDVRLGQRSSLEFALKLGSLKRERRSRVVRPRRGRRLHHGGGRPGQRRAETPARRSHLHRHPVPGAGRQRLQRCPPGQPVDRRGQRPRQHRQRRLRRRRDLLDRLRLPGGRPLTALAANPNYGTAGEIPLTRRGGGIQTVDGVRTRTPFEYALDAHADYTIKVGSAQRVVLLADAFNLLNRQAATNYDSYVELSNGTPNPNYGFPTNGGGSLATGYQAPRRVRLGARFEW